MSASNVSHHLSVLRAHGLVRFRREGRQIFYEPDDDHIRLLLDLTLEHVRHGAAGDGPSAGDAPNGRVRQP
jgi:DNA-binding transcriptional ArsR family regulator